MRDYMSESNCEQSLLSAAGIPKLRRISKDKLRFNGKGNEVGSTSQSRHA